MRITTRASYDIETGTLLEWQGYDYCGPIAEAKGGNSKSEMTAADAARSAALAQQQQYMNAGLGLLGVDPTGKGGTPAPGSLMSYLSPILQSGGVTPATAALQAQGINTAGDTYRNAMGQFNQINARYGLTGGDNAGGGGIGQNFGALQAALGGQLQGVNTNVAQLQGQNFNSALGTLGGITNTLFGAGQGWGQQGLGFGNQGVTAANNADQAQTSWMGPVFGALGSLGSAGIGKAPCWVARAVYGDDSPFVGMVRYKLFSKAETSYGYRLVLATYIAIGEPVAWVVKRVSPLKKAFRKLMDKFIGV